MLFKRSAIAALALALSCSAVSVASTGFAADAELSDVNHLACAIHASGKLTAADDVSGDKLVNVIDLALLKRSIVAPTKEVSTADYPITAENVKLIGRTLNKSDVTWLVQSGSAAEFTVTATEATLTLAGDGNVNSDEKYRPRYAVYVDGELLTDALLGVKELEIPLFSGKTRRTATVRVIHLSEANNGAIGVKKLTATSDAAHPVLPTAEKELSIEFIGDSITCGYGVEGESQYVSFMTSTENFMKTYAYYTAELLDADYSAVSYSGYGIVSGYTSDGVRNTSSLVPDCYKSVGKLADYASPWDFGGRSHDVVVINLGTNDNTYLSKDMATRSAEFTEEYKKFLATVRECNPDAYIICTVGTMGCEDVYPLIESAVSSYSESAKDERITSYLSAVQNQADGIGSDWHPSSATHMKSAYVLADKICTALGMESSKMGLDVAADGTYDVALNEAAGAYAAQYVGYDKSFWINTSGGGKENTDIIAFVEDMPLVNGKYRLEFDYVSSITADIPYTVQSMRDGEAVYLSGSIAVSTDKQHETQTFDMEKPDSACRLQFLLGGTDNYSVTLSNISLTKIAE